VMPRSAAQLTEKIHWKAASAVRVRKFNFGLEVMLFPPLKSLLPWTCGNRLDRVTASSARPALMRSVALEVYRTGASGMTCNCDGTHQRRARGTGRNAVSLFRRSRATAISVEGKSITSKPNQNFLTLLLTPLSSGFLR